MQTTTRQYYQVLLRERAAGVPFSSSWLREKGISASLASHYVRQGFLQRLGHGFYALPKESIDVCGMLFAVQDVIPGFHVAGRTALEWNGIRHNLYSKPQTIVWGMKPRAIPKWMAERFNIRYSTANLFDFQNEEDDLSTRPVNPYMPHKVRCSCVERALLEMLYELPKLDVEEVQNLFELIQFPRRRVLSMLLEACRSIKVVRLFAQFSSEASMLDVTELYENPRIETGAPVRWRIAVGDGRKITVKPLNS